MMLLRERSFAHDEGGDPVRYRSHRPADRRNEPGEKLMGPASALAKATLLRIANVLALFHRISVG